MSYLDKVLLGNVEPFEHEIIINEDIDNFLLKEGFVQDYDGPKPRFKRYVSGPTLRVEMAFFITSEYCRCYIDDRPIHDFNFNRDDYQNFISHYTLLIDRLSKYYKN